MRGILLLNGQPYDGKINTDGAYVVCCDGAYSWVNGRVAIDENVGDFDSYDGIPYPPPKCIYPSEKNFTDGEIAVERLLAVGVDSITVYGGGGGREDHFLGNLHLLYRAHRNGVPAVMINRESVLYLGSGSIEINGAYGKTFSLLPFGGAVHIMGSEGCKYAYPEEIGYGECRGISNIALSNHATVRIAESETALIIINRGNV